MQLPEESFRFVQYRYPNKMEVELLEPIGDGGFLARFLERRGEGVHHLTFKVTDIERRLDHLRSVGIEPVQVALEGRWKEGFIHAVPIQASTPAGSLPHRERPGAGPPGPPWCLA